MDRDTDDETAPRGEAQEPIVDWSSSPAASDAWGFDIDVALPSTAGSIPQAVAESQDAPVARPSRPQRRESARAEERQPAGQAARAQAGPGRSILGGLVFLALGAYVAWVAMLCLQDLGRQHVQARSAEGAALAGLQQDHAAVTQLLILNALVAAPFLLGAALQFGGQRRAAQFFGLVGLVAAVYLLYWTTGPASAYLRQTDVTLKIGLMVAAAWFA